MEKETVQKLPEELIKKLEEGCLTEEEFMNLTQEMREAGLTGLITAVDDPDSPEAEAAAEYIEYHKKLPAGASEGRVEEACQKLLSEKSSLEEKKLAILLLAHTGKERPLAVLKEYGESPDEELKVWVNMAIDECRSFMAGNLLGEPIINVSKVTKVGRNEPCPCGSGIKFKRCCGR